MRRISGVVMVAAVLALSGCGNRKDGEFKDGKAVAVPEVNEVEVVTLQKTDFTRQLLSNGKLSANRKASLSFGVSGTVARLEAGNGDKVAKGEVIAVLDRPDLKLSLDAAQIALEKAELDFYDVLAGQGYSARDTSAVPADVLAMAKMRSGYTSAINSLARAELEYKGTVLKSPYSGKVADVDCKVYESAGADKFCTVIDDSSLDVDFTVMESEYEFLSGELQVKVMPFSAQNVVLPGRITGINPTVNAKGQIEVRATVDNDGSLIDGMNAKVIVERIIPEQLVVPRSAVVVRDNLDVLFTYTDDGVAHWTYVDIVRSNSDSHVVRANADRGAVLNEGDRVIVSGNLNLADGSKVRLKTR